MNAEDGSRKDRPGEIDGETDRLESRRRLLKAGLVAVPFLVILHALPARAGGRARAPSGSTVMAIPEGEANPATPEGEANLAATGEHRDAEVVRRCGRDGAFRCAFLAGAVAVALVAPCAGRAEDPVSIDSTKPAASPEVALLRPRFEASRPLGSKLFHLNQFLDPVQGSTYPAFSRAAGFGQCDSLGPKLGSGPRWAPADESAGFERRPCGDRLDLVHAGHASAVFARLRLDGQRTAKATEETGSPAVPTSEATAKPVLSWETGAGKSYLIPALDIVGFDFLLNQFDRRVLDAEAYGSNLSTIRHNLSNRWVVDTDPFAVNQFGHPFQGTFYHQFARSAGLGYWQSLGYTVAGSVLWEEAGENTTPSINDQIATGFGGTFLGEPLFRMASRVLEGAGGKPGFWKTLRAAVTSPSTYFNRLAFGDRFDAVFPSREPAVFTRVQLGGSWAARVSEQGDSHTVKRLEATADSSIAYGLPGKPDYDYDRPFDYFHFEFTASSKTFIENIMSRGLLVGRKYEAGDAFRGIWGLYGSYDYIAPQIFRISSNAVSIGTSAQWWLSRAVALQGTALAGTGYGAAGTIHGSGERDYHYGATVQELLAFRFIFGDRVTLDATGRHYYVSGVGSPEKRGAEYILRGDTALTVRVYRRHAITLKYVESHRNAHYPDLVGRYQTVGVVSLAYTHLGDTRFGAVEWRDAPAIGP